MKQLPMSFWFAEPSWLGWNGSIGYIVIWHILVWTNEEHGWKSDRKLCSNGTAHSAVAEDDFSAEKRWRSEYVAELSWYESPIHSNCHCQKDTGNHGTNIITNYMFRVYVLICCMIFLLTISLACCFMKVALGPSEVAKCSTWGVWHLWTQRIDENWSCLTIEPLGRKSFWPWTRNDISAT